MADLDPDVPDAITSLVSLVESITATATSSALLADATGFLNDTPGLDLGGAGLENGAGAGNPVVRLMIQWRLRADARAGQLYPRDDHRPRRERDECLWTEPHQDGSRPYPFPPRVAVRDLMRFVDARASVAKGFASAGLAETDVAARDVGVHVSIAFPS